MFRLDSPRSLSEDLDSVPCRILVVDDNRSFRETLADVLTDFGCDVVQAGNGEAALNALREPGAAVPDLILLDLRLPQVNGWQFREEQLSDVRLALIPVIAVSGIGSKEDLEHEAEILQADGWVHKPFLFNELLTAIRQVCPWFPG
jgi:CheY-like chemotaxis protein